MHGSVAGFIAAALLCMDFSVMFIVVGKRFHELQRKIDGKVLSTDSPGSGWLRGGTHAPDTTTAAFSRHVPAAFDVGAGAPALAATAGGDEFNVVSGMYCSAYLS